VATRVLQTPPRGTLEAWAWDVIHDQDLERKLAPPAPPGKFEEVAIERRTCLPSRPAPLSVSARAAKTPRPGALVRPEVRARLLHVFLHHELQAAEIFCWALLAFPQTPEEFRRGLVRLTLDELRHARAYRVEIERLGSSLGAFPVRDWFWERFASCQTPLEFVALMGLGFEAGNLDHCSTWAERFRAAGDEQGARCQELIEVDEVEHVAFAATWFRAFHGQLDFDSWRRALPAPLTPTVLRGNPINREARKQAGLDEAFLGELEAWDRAEPGC
jgi:uncharacterized ferritin-like protein (DUF455 family)